MIIKEEKKDIESQEESTFENWLVTHYGWNGCGWIEKAKTASIVRNTEYLYNKYMGNFFPSLLEPPLEKKDMENLPPNFWSRLEMFVKNVEVNDAMAEEEKEMILLIAGKQKDSSPIKGETAEDKDAAYNQIITNQCAEIEALKKDNDRWRMAAAEAWERKQADLDNYANQKLGLTPSPPKEE